jgi:hypothetical protein
MQTAPGLGIRLSGRGPFPVHVPIYVLRLGGGVPEVRREAVDGALLHRRGDVAVDVHRRRDGAVAEAFLDDLGVLAELQQQRRVRVPQPLEGEAGKALDLGAGPIESPGPSAVIASGTRMAPRSSPNAWASARARSREIAPRPALWVLSTLRVSASMSITRALPVLMTLAVLGAVTSTARRTLILPVLTLMSDQRSASASERRMPV